MKQGRGRVLTVALMAVLAGGAGVAAPQHVVWVEAEGFATLGGWVIDSQVMDQMGSPFLMAHGLGRPVADAETRVKVPVAGAYRVWARTRDWNAPWGGGKEPPGRFQILINGKPLPAVFGTQGEAWQWQSGGTVELAQGEAALALRDLTGFNGRCDAILLTTDAAFMPPHAGDELARLRRQSLGLPERPEDGGTFDLVVVGGGIAGTCAAVSAARLGLTVALLHDRPYLGGNNSSEVRVHLCGRVNLPPYPALGGLVRELGPATVGNAQPPEKYDDARKTAVVQAETNLTLFLNTRVNAVEAGRGRLAAVLGQDVRSGRRTRVAGRWFVDSTGDGNLGFLAGADYRYGRESRDETGEALAPERPDRLVMGTSVQWYSRVTDAPTSFPETPWAVAFTAANYQKAHGGEWNWETGFAWDQIAEFEKVRDHGLRAVFGNWSYQKNHAPDKERYAKRELDWVAHIGGKRESRRMLGDIVLKQQDIVERVAYPDAAVTTTWTIDLHYPTDAQTEHFPGQEFRSYAKHIRIEPYPIPYRCFYSRNVENLFMAGRNISVTHVALGTVRVMRTLGMVGEVVGMAASVCKRHGVQPRQVYTDHLDELKALMTQGVSKLPLPTPAGPPKPPEWVGAAGPNLAREARVTVSSQHSAKQYVPAHINDGRVSYTDNGLRWVSDPEAEGPVTVELAWGRKQSVGAVRLVTGQAGGGEGATTPITAFVIQYQDGAAWRDIEATKTDENALVDWHARFPAVTADRLRLVVTRTPGNLARIWEWEVYGPVTVPR